MAEPAKFVQQTLPVHEQIFVLAVYLSSLDGIQFDKPVGGNPRLVEFPVFMELDKIMKTITKIYHSICQMYSLLLN